MPYQCFRPGTGTTAPHSGGEVSFWFSTDSFAILFASVAMPLDFSAILFAALALPLALIAMTIATICLADGSESACVRIGKRGRDGRKAPPRPSAYPV